jgi:outer membrane receptor protein involved in Fe transport
VLTGGASAVYGADAVGGVVNFIMNHNFEGVRIDAQYSIYQHSQHNDYIQGVVRAARAAAAVPDNYIVPGDFKGGEGSEVSLTMGVNAPDGKGNITAYATYISINPVTANNYDYTACSLNSGTTFAAAGCGGSGHGLPCALRSGRSGRPAPIRATSSSTRPAPATPSVRGTVRTSTTSPRPTTCSVLTNATGLGAFAHYEISPMFEAYTDVMFMEDTSTAQIAPGGVFSLGGPNAGLYSINCNNPLMTLTQQNQLCGAGFGGTNTNVDVNVARRNVEGGGRTTEFKHNEYRIVVGLKGQLSENWSYDAFMQYGSTTVSDRTNNYFITSRIANSLRAVRNAAGQIVCESVVNGTDPACVPYNIFQIGGVTPAALNYLSAPAFDSGSITERVANINVVGLLLRSRARWPTTASGSRWAPSIVASTSIRGGLRPVLGSAERCRRGLPAGERRLRRATNSSARPACPWCRTSLGPRTSPRNWPTASRTTRTPGSPTPTRSLVTGP